MQILPTSSIGNFVNKLRATPSDKLSPTDQEAALHKLNSQDSLVQKKSRFNWKLFFMAFTVFGVIAAIVLASVALAVDVTTNPSLVDKLKLAATNYDRMQLLPKDSDWEYDFTKQAKYTFAPGGVVSANAATFPATVGMGLTMAMLNLGPCAMLPPHFHPRATNYVVAVSGETETFMIAENGVRTVKTTLTPGKMTIFPQGSVHTMRNLGCENAQLVSALSSEDAGTHNLANALFSLPSDILGPVLGSGVNTTAEINAIPPVGTGSNAGPESCLAMCKAQGKKVRRTW